MVRLVLEFFQAPAGGARRVRLRRRSFFFTPGRTAGRARPTNSSPFSVLLLGGSGIGEIRRTRTEDVNKIPVEALERGFLARAGCSRSIAGVVGDGGIFPRDSRGGGGGAIGGRFTTAADRRIPLAEEEEKGAHSGNGQEKLAAMTSRRRLGRAMKRVARACAAILIRDPKQDDLRPVSGQAPKVEHSGGGRVLSRGFAGNVVGDVLRIIGQANRGWLKELRGVSSP